MYTPLFYFPAQLVGDSNFSGRLNEPWSQASSSLSPDIPWARYSTILQNKNAIAKMKSIFSVNTFTSGNPGLGTNYLELA